MNYLFVLNVNQFVEIPRQHGKTVSALVWYLWVFNFATKNTKIMFANKKHDDAKTNLKTFKNLREMLPEYLQMANDVDQYGNKIKAPNTAEKLQSPVNGNLIVTLPGARNPSLADGAGRGATMAIQYYDEFAFLPYNEIVYTAAVPAFSRASQNAAQNGVPYGMLITTTPGDLTTKEGQYADDMRNKATQWDESFYDRSYEEIKAMIKSNVESSFIHIRYTYQMLGDGPEYFENMVRDMGANWPKIRREVMLEWARMADNNPFDREDLEMIDAYTKDEPKYTLFFGKHGQFQMKFWDSIPMGSQYPPIVGVDVSTGVGKDFSAITVIDSETTKVIATLKSNCMSTPELADTIYRFVTQYARNAVVAIENNGATDTFTNPLFKDIYLDRITMYHPAYKVICTFPRVNCFEVGQEPYILQRDLQRCA